MLTRWAGTEACPQFLEKPSKTCMQLGLRSLNSTEKQSVEMEVTVGLREICDRTLALLCSYASVHNEVSSLRILFSSIFEINTNLQMFLCSFRKLHILLHKVYKIKLGLGIYCSLLVEDKWSATELP
jgi:hypothetical protein